ncbi:MAG TPA: IS110 family transposase [Streptosporangiaceae bacterium]|nr:IS110 family transposase [Streptosporangiaceae bacterium]
MAREVGAVVEPQEIEDEEHEQVLERVAAIDVAKASGMVCTRVPHPARPGRRRSLVWQVDATMNAVLELADHLVAERVQKVTLESTSDYWRIWYYLLEAAGLDVQLVRAADLRRAPGRPKTDKLDCIWQAKCTERGLLRPSFVPPAEIRVLRDYTRMRTDLTRERTRYYSRLEKLLEDALIKVSAVASKITAVSVRDMVEALIAGERDPQVLAGLARGAMRARHDKLVQALTGRFDAHHGELARMLLGQIDGLTAQIDMLTTRIEELIAAIPEARGVDPDGTTGPGAGQAPGSPVLPAVDRLDEITGIGRDAAQVIIAEIGLDMSRFPTAGHLVSWARLTPQTMQSGATTRGGKTGKGDPYLKGVLGSAVAAAGRTDTFLGQRYRRLARRRGKLKALVAVARSILVIAWHLLSDRDARFHDLGADYYTSRIDKNRKTRSHVRQLEALGYTVVLAPAA